MNSKTTITVISVLALLMTGTTPALASPDSDRDALSIVLDVTVARPVTFALTIVGSAMFAVTLPVAIPTGTVKEVAHTLVSQPAKDTFTRPVGDLDDFLDY